MPGDDSSVTLLRSAPLTEDQENAEIDELFPMMMTKMPKPSRAPKTANWMPLRTHSSIGCSMATEPHRISSKPSTSAMDSGLSTLPPVKDGGVSTQRKRTMSTTRT